MLRAGLVFLLIITVLCLIQETQIVSAAEDVALTVRVQTCDVETSLPIPNMTVSLYLTTRESVYFVSESELVTFQGVTNGDGLIVTTLDITEVPQEPLRLLITSLFSQPPALWIVEKVAGDEEYNLWGNGEDWQGPRWMGLQPDQFFYNISTYIFPLPIPLSTYEDGSTVELTLYLRRGRLVNLTLINPFQGDDPWYFRAVPSYLWRGYFDQRNLYYSANCYLSGNFAPIDNTTLVVAPLDRRLEGTALIARVSGLRSWGGFDEILRSWTFSFSFAPEESDRINLTPLALQTIRKNSQDELSPLLGDLKARGFSVSHYYTELGRMVYNYEQAISAFEGNSTSEGVVFSRKAYELYGSLMGSIQRIPTYALPQSGWIILTLLFFSFCLSCLVTEDRAKALVLFDLLFFTVFVVFAMTQPYLKLFLSDPVASFRKLDIEFLGAFMQIGIPAIMIALFLALSKMIRDLFRQSFGVALKNLRRRRMRTILTLTVILIVSASAMCLLSTEYPVHSMVATLPLQPLVPYGLVVYKYSFGVTSVSPLSFQPFEINWLAQQGWVNASSIYGVKLVSISNSTTRLQRYNQFYLAVVNESFLERFTNVGEVLGSQRLADGGYREVLIGERIAEAYELKVGSEILIDGKAFTVKGIFKEPDVGERLLEINGENLLYRVYDPATRTVIVPPTVYPPYPQTGFMAASFLIGSIHDFSPSELNMYKVSLVMKPEFANDIDKIVEDVLWASYERKEDYVNTFSIYEVKSGRVSCKYLSFETLTVVGSWQTQIAPLAICGMIVFVTLHGSVFERKSEIKTLSALGLNPLRIRMMFLIEGLTLGVLGGVLGYVLGFGLVKLGNIALLEGIEENMATGTPLFVSMVISVLVSIAGCLLPAKEAVLLAVPSKELLKKYAGIIDVRGNYAVLDVPLRINVRNLGSFDTFIIDIAKRYPMTSTPHGMFVADVEKKETMDSLAYDITVCYASERTAHYLVRAALSKETEPIKVTTYIFPLSGDSLEIIDRWTVDHEHLLPRLAPIIRQDFLGYIERK